jgi:hypothetical protein
MRLVISAVCFLSFCTLAMGQKILRGDSVETVTRTFDNSNKTWKKKDYRLQITNKYSESVGEGVIIQNSLPKGGGYTNANGEKFGYRIFFTRLINETAAPLELTINFSADSFAILNSPGSYLKLFLPPDTMTLAKEILYSYGVTGLESLLDTPFRPTLLRRIINPKDECLFYVGMLIYQANNITSDSANTYQPSGGGARAELILRERDLFYRINLVDSALIPCGYIISKK